VIGTVLSIRYELTQTLGESPVFTAYAARDRVSGRDVCVRVLKSPFASEKGFAQKLAEAGKKGTSVQHPGIEGIWEADEHEDAPFLVGELSRGVSLGDRIRKLAPFSVPVSVGIAISMLEALDALHNTGHVHGDLNTNNIVSMPDGSVRLQLAGVWEAYSESPSAGSLVLPTMAPYLAPEVSAGEMPNQSTDVYSAGIVLYELLAGRLPYIADTPVGMAARHAGSATPSVRMFNPSVPTVLDEIVKKSMAKDPASRYTKAGEMLSDLRMLQDALRFGRSLSWPIRPSAVGAKQPVAPKMSAARDEQKEEQRQRERPSRDIPVWVMMSAAFSVAIVLVLVLGLILFQSIRPRDVDVPNIEGMTVAEARNSIAGLNLDLRIGAREASDKHPADTIMEVYPPPGDKVREGAQLSVRVSSGSRFVEVPDLRGRTEDQAKSLLSSLNLQMDDRVEHVRRSNVEAGMIVEQVPEPRTKVERFTNVRVKIASGDGRPVMPTTRSNDNVKYLYSLRIGLSSITEPVELRVDMTDARGTSTIYERRHMPGDVVDASADGFGAEAVFRVFYNGEMVSQVRKRADEEAPL
jgi:eukaryotic-like serine/threonine-protein kinase